MLKFSAPDRRHRQHQLHIDSGSDVLGNIQTRVRLCRCTIQKECAQGLAARSWISMGDGPQQCPSMTLTPPEISITADIKVRTHKALHAFQACVCVAPAEIT